MLKVLLLIVVTYSDNLMGVNFFTLWNAISVLLSGVHGLKI